MIFKSRGGRNYFSYSSCVALLLLSLYYYFLAPRERRLTHSRIGRRSICSMLTVDHAPRSCIIIVMLTRALEKINNKYVHKIIKKLCSQYNIILYPYRILRLRVCTHIL